MKRVLAFAYTLVLALLISSLIYVPVLSETRHVTVPDVVWGQGSTTELGHTGLNFPYPYIGRGTTDDNSVVLDVRMYGAVLGTGKSTAVKDNNAAAIQAAFDNIVATSGGTILIPGVIEVGANVLNFGSATSTWFHCNVVGLGPTVSKIVSESTTNVIDAAGRNYLSIRDLQITSTTAQIGVLLGRTTTAGNANKNDFTNVWVTGTYSIATFVWIAAESSSFHACRFSNTGTAPTYWIGTKNLMSATTANGTLISVASANSNIDHFGTQFLNESATDNQVIVRIGNAANINFFGGIISTSGTSGNRLIQLDTDTSTWYGLLNLNGVQIEDGNAAGDSTGIYFATGSNMAYYNIDISACYFNLSGASSKVFGYVDNTVTATQLRFLGNRLSVTNPTLSVQNLINSHVENYSETGDITVVAGTYVKNSKLAAKTITWGSGAYGLGGWYTTGSDTVFGVQTFGPQPSSDSGDTGGTSRGSTIQLAKQDAPPIAGNRVIGGIYMVDSPTWAAAGITPTDNTPFPVWWDGTQYRPAGAIVATPANATAACSKGAVAIDNQYVYWCYSTDNWRRVAYDNTW